MSQNQSTNVSFACSGCGKKFSAPSSFAGKSIQCGCGAGVSIPAASRPQSSPQSNAPAAPRQPAHVPPTIAARTPATSTNLPQRVTPGVNVCPTTQGGPTAPRPALPQALPPKVGPATSNATAVAILAVVAMAGVVLIGGTTVSRFVQRATRTAARVVPGAEALFPIRLISQAEVDAVISETSTNDISSANVYQQMATYANGAMKMSSLVALSFGAASSAVNENRQSAETAEIGTTTVHQQTAVYLEGMLAQLALAARSAGCTVADVESVLSRVRTGDISSDTVHQQLATYCSGSVRLMELIAIKQGAPAARVQALMGTIGAGDTSADTVHQQNANYLAGLAHMTALAANARGASDTRVDAVLQAMRSADIGTTTVFQQEVTSLGGVIKCLGILAVGN